VNTGPTSMHIVVSVSFGAPATRVLTTATVGLMVFVAVGTDGRLSIGHLVEVEARLIHTAASSGT